MSNRLPNPEGTLRVAPVPDRSPLPVLLPRPLPRTLSISRALLPLEDAASAVAALEVRLDAAPFRDRFLLAESRLDALQLGAAAPPVAAPTDERRGAELLRLLVIEASEDRSAPRDLRPVVNALAAYDLACAAVRESGRAALTLDLLCRMHVAMCSGIALPGAPGQWRRPGASISGRGRSARILPPAAEDLPAALADLQDFLLDPPPIPFALRAAMVTAQMESLCPFEYGNAHLARMLLPLMAAAEGRPPVFAVHPAGCTEAGYEAALADLQLTGDWEGWLCAFLQRLSDAARQAVGRVARMQALQHDWSARLGSLRSDSTARRLSELVLGVPVLTVGVAQSLLDVSFQTANAAVASLVRLDIVSPHANARRNRIFVARETLAVLTMRGGVEGDGVEPPLAVYAAPPAGATAALHPDAAICR